MSKKYRIRFGKPMILSSVTIIDENANPMDAVDDGSGVNELTGQFVSIPMNTFIENAPTVSMFEFELYSTDLIHKVMLTTGGLRDHYEFGLEDITDGENCVELFYDYDFEIELGMQYVHVIRMPKHVQMPAEIDKTRLPKLKTRIIAGEHLELLDVLSVLIGKTDVAFNLLNAMIDGRDYITLTTTDGFKTTDSLKALAVFNLSIDISRYTREKAIALIKDDFEQLSAFNTFITGQGLEKLTLNSLGRLYSDADVNNALENWYNEI